MSDSSLRKCLLVGVLCFFFSGIALMAAFVVVVAPPGRNIHAPAEIFMVPSGQGLQEIIHRLHGRGFLSHKLPFRVWVALEQADGRVKAGEYVLHPAMSPRGILDILTRGGVLTHRVTIPEGFTARQIARLLAREGLCTETAFLKATRKPELGRPYGLSAGLEGFLFPDTYHFSRGLSATTLARIMVRRFFTVIEPLQPRISQSELDLPEIVTLASIVEKETGTPNERPLIASVFINRLRRNMRLQSDPTVIYGIRDFNGNLTRKDLKTPGPYNTYRNSGLPPGPIANPGLAAIEAVLSPAQTRYLYFVSKNNGTHHFSRTLREHNQAVRRYQLGRN